MNRESNVWTLNLLEISPWGTSLSYSPHPHLRLCFREKFIKLTKANQLLYTFYYNIISVFSTYLEQTEIHNT